MATAVQAVVFYTLAATCMKCLKPTDWAVRFLHVHSCEVSDAVRARRFFLATAIGFTIANVFCWLMNRWFVFEPGLHVWYVEFMMFFCVSAMATLIALGLSWSLIRYASMMTTLAVAVEIAVSFAVNFFVRKFFIFKG